MVVVSLATGGLFFITTMTRKRGGQPLPEHLKRQRFDAMVTKETQDHIHILCKYYKLSEGKLIDKAIADLYVRSRR